MHPLRRFLLVLFLLLPVLFMLLWAEQWLRTRGVFEGYAFLMLILAATAVSVLRSEPGLQTPEQSARATSSRARAVLSLAASLAAWGLGVFINLGRLGPAYEIVCYTAATGMLFAVLWFLPSQPLKKLTAWLWRWSGEDERLHGFLWGCVALAATIGITFLGLKVARMLGGT